MRNFREYEVWKNSIPFIKKVYQIANDYPENEKFGLKRQIQDASISISSNIAEGCSRSSPDFDTGSPRNKMLVKRPLPPTRPLLFGTDQRTS